MILRNIKLYDMAKFLKNMKDKDKKITRIKE